MGEWNEMSNDVDVIGNVEKIATRSGRGAKGPWTAYNVLLSEGGKETWVSFGFDAPEFTEGDRIKTTGFLKDGKYLTYIKGAPIKVKAADKPANGSGNQSSGGGGDRQASIIYQSSRKDALQLVEILLANDALPVSGAKSKSGEAKRFDEIKAFVDKLTVEFFHDVDTLRKLDEVEDAGAVEEKPVDELPPNDEDPEENSDFPEEEEDDDDF